MKTNELTGKLLDHWVARAEGMGKRGTNYVAYSSSWGMAGKIIAREWISLDGGSVPSEPVWHARTVLRSVEHATMAPCYRMIDTDPLVAAMRAYVASKFGDEVPDV